jgi:hypothetical protein
MTAVEFERLSTELRKLVRNIPLNWGHIQNNGYDRLVNMFDIDSYEALEIAIAPHNYQVKTYFRRRWYLWQCSRCDEYLFAINDNVNPNPDQYDQSYDIEFNGNLRFDIKGTIIPRKMRHDIDDIINNPQPMVDFFYEEQSKGVRNAFQNRLFIVHHSFVDSDREFYLRCAWESKEKIYSEYAKMTTKSRFFYKYRDCLADVIFILEREKSKVEYIIHTL